MNKTTFFFFTLLSLGLFSNCKKDKDSHCSCVGGSSLVFGSYYGMCAGENCVEIFKIEDGVLYEDSNDNYPSDSPYNGNYSTLPSAKYDLVKNLPARVPALLLNESNGYIGQPDSYDQGGYVLELIENGATRYWRIDSDTSNIPSYLHPFTDTLKTYINKLQ